MKRTEKLTNWSNYAYSSIQRNEFKPPRNWKPIYRKISRN